jgi:dihydrofolate synthase/folylpolyglutamate synthase
VRTGLYTSPHLARVNERIRMDGRRLPTRRLPALLSRHDAAQKLVLGGRLPQLPSFFEILTAQALLYFAEAGVEIAVLEVGMGGRLDATNIVDPLLSVITDISLDHMEWLGSTIARHCAGEGRHSAPRRDADYPAAAPGGQPGSGRVAAELGVRG